MREEDILKGLGAKIREYRLAAGLSQEDLAVKSKLSRDTIGNLERGENFLAAGSLGRIAVALKKNIDDLFVATPRVSKPRREAKIDKAVADLKAALLSGEKVELADIRDLLKLVSDVPKPAKSTKVRRKR